MRKLSVQERLRRIRERLSSGGVSVPVLARELGISEITIRRDLAALQRQGKLLRVYGGAIPSERVAYEFSFKEKESRQRREKEAIGRAAAELAEPGTAVFLDTGTTAVAIARALRAIGPGIILTTNLGVASEFVGQGDVRVIMPGGELGRRSPDLLGEMTLEALSGMNVDVAFLGCDAVDPAEGFFTTDSRSAAVSRLMLSRSARCYLVADSGKFGQRAMFRIAQIERLTGIVTDSGLAAPYRKTLAQTGVDLIVAELKGDNA